MKILHLTLTAWPFELTQQGFKPIEYREYSKWIKSRLIDSKTGEPKKYDAILYRHGYEKNKPYVLVRYLGFEQAKKNYTVNLPKLTINVRKSDFRIYNGAVLRRGNIDSLDIPF